MNDAEKTAVLQASLLNIGRLLPPGVEVSFFHEGSDPHTQMQIRYSDGTTTDYAFASYEPIFQNPADWKLKP